MKGRLNEGGKVSVSYFVSTMESQLPENETDLYTDKTVTEIEQPELRACSNENVVKDICIDEGVRSLDKILVGNEEADHMRYIVLLKSELDENRDLTKGTEVNDGQLISSEGKKVAKKGSPEILEVEGGGNVDATDDVVNDIYDEKVMPQKLLLVQELDEENEHADSSSSYRHEDQKHVWNSMDSTDVRSHGSSDETNLATSTVPSASEVPNQSRDAKDFPFDSKAESSITYNFDSSSQMASVIAEGAENTDCPLPGQILNASVLEDDVLDSLTGSTRSFFIQHGLGESSFSGTGSVSGPLGSISFRSDSSTTSTRSFAFPILHTEWNSSPIKMAKADRRHYRKHRGWRVALLCCRF